MNILLHICCSNCALYPVKSLREEGHSFTGLWYNPNIHPSEEYTLRLESLKKLSDEWKIDVIYEEGYRPEEYFSMFDMNDKTLIEQFCFSSSGGPNGSDSWNGLKIPQYRERCKSCYRQRLTLTAEKAKAEGFDAFTTTLLISPYQDFAHIMQTGKDIAEQHDLVFYQKDYRPYFRDGMALSREMGLYRQKYCGCIFSREERKTQTSKT